MWFIFLILTLHLLICFCFCFFLFYYITLLNHPPLHLWNPPCHHLHHPHHPHCRQENGSMHIPPMETSFSHWNMSLLSQVENPIIGRIFAGNPNIWFFRCLPNRDVISS